MIEEVLQKINVLPTNSNYWFVRTDGGGYFETFYENNFIAIGWNEITLDDLKRSDIEVKEKIERVYRLDKKIRNDKAKITDIYNKVKRFKDLRKNDVIIIPNEKSEFIAFGIIIDEHPYQYNQQQQLGCPFLKRRSVKWVVGRPFNSLDDVFYKIKKSRHAISDVNIYATHIDSVMYSVYKKENFSHFVVKIQQHDTINWHNLALTLVEMYDLMSQINTEFQLGEDVADSSIRIALQSPGLFNLAQKGIALVLLATALGATSCSGVRETLPQNDKEKLDTFQQSKIRELDSIRTKLNSMNVDL